MNWIKIENNKDLDRIMEESKEGPVVIFKHSTRCSISSMALSRLEWSWSDDEMAHVKSYYLDLISYREVSDQVAEKFKVEHQSPQVLLLKNGEVVYNTSHMGISYESIKEEVKN